MIFKLFPILLSLLIFLFCGTGLAIEVAPRISDREIIEKLTRLEEGQKSLRQEMNQRFKAMENTMDQRFEAIDQRFEAIDQRFEAIDQRFESMENSMNQRFEAIDQRFESMENSMNQRFDGIRQLFTILASMLMVVIAGILGLVGFIIWDRKTALQPLEKKMDKLEQEFLHNLELQKPVPA